MKIYIKTQKYQTLSDLIKMLAKFMKYKNEKLVYIKT
jgi:hypothetical protein